MTTLAELLAQSDITQAQLATHLDALVADEHVAQCRQLGRALQRRLWNTCAGAPAVTLEDLIPAASTTEVRWAGKNSLGVFTQFEKRFFRHNGTVVGYNVNPGIQFLTGPGYFTTEPARDRPRELLFDYTRVPSTPPPGWPPVKPNTGGIAQLIYGNMHDFCRRVGQHVIIGAATRLGKPLGAYFVLARL